MANFGFGSIPPGVAADADSLKFDPLGGFDPAAFEQLARQYWSAWGQMMQGAPAQAAQPSAPGWNEAVQWWSQLAKGGQPQADDTIDRFNSQARGWFAQIQRLAAQFAGREASPSDIAGAWKQALGGQGANPFAEVFGAMRGPGQQDFARWAEQLGPWLQGLQHQGRDLLGLPAFGFAREHQERVQRLLQAHLDYQQQSQAYHALMAEAGQDAFARFEDKLAERSEPGRQLSSARALFDLWIDAAEEAYAEIALSPRFRDAYAALVNSQMRLRAGVQKEVEHASGSIGMPTRTEIDAAHRKIVQLERELRRLRDEMGQLRRGAAPQPAAAAAERAERAERAAPPAAKVRGRSAAARPASASKPPAARSAAPQSGAAKSAVAKSGATKRAAKRTAAKPAVAKPAVAKKASRPVQAAAPAPSRSARKPRTAIARPAAPAHPTATAAKRSGKAGQ